MLTGDYRAKLRALLHHEAAGGVILVLAALLAILLENSRFAWLPDAFLDTPVTVRVGDLWLDKPLLLWINDGLMAIFFFVVGLEIKRELLIGELSTPAQAALPVLAAVGGMIVPALVYVIITLADASSIKGWAIPAATDIAFAIGVVALLGRRVPASLKIFLLALAIIDDLGAIVIIALFYTGSLSLISLALAALGVLVLVALNRTGVERLAPYLLAGLFIWVCVLKSGVHATLAGVVVAIAIPLVPSESGPSLLERLQDSLHPWVTFAVLPAFAFANAGVSFAGVSLYELFEPIPLGIAAGLFIGKQVGIFGAVWLAVRAGLANLPEGASWQQLYGIALLGGIGFTMSLFIGTLAFPSPGDAASVRLGVITGSLLSAIAGYAVLRFYASNEKTV
jgi:Na+:H+ antiporter, NhaA family